MKPVNLREAFYKGFGLPSQNPRLTRSPGPDIRGFKIPPHLASPPPTPATKPEPPSAAPRKRKLPKSGLRGRKPKPGPGQMEFPFMAEGFRDFIRGAVRKAVPILTSGVMAVGAPGVIKANQTGTSSEQGVETKTTYFQPGLPKSTSTLNRSTSDIKHTNRTASVPGLGISDRLPDVHTNTQSRNFSKSGTLGGYKQNVSTVTKTVGTHAPVTTETEDSSTTMKPGVRYPRDYDGNDNIATTISHTIYDKTPTSSQHLTGKVFPAFNTTSLRARRRNIPRTP